MMGWLETLAIRFLKSRGRYPTPPPAVGMVISGNAVAHKLGGGRYDVLLAYPEAPVWVLFGSLLIDVARS